MDGLIERQYRCKAGIKSFHYGTSFIPGLRIKCWLQSLFQSRQMSFIGMVFELRTIVAHALLHRFEKFGFKGPKRNILPVSRLV
jgi:hypothetical protein